MVDELIKEIENLFNTDITDYRISKDTGITLSVVQGYRNDKNKLENMTLKVANKLYKYAEGLKMRNYDKMIRIVDELVLEEGAWVSYWHRSNPNDGGDAYSVEELKVHIGNMSEEELPGMVFQVNFEDDNGDKSYQFYLREYEDVVNGNDFFLGLLHNER